MIKGQPKNIALPPMGFKDLDPKETFIPFHLDLRNGKITRAGNWENRNGYGEKWDIEYDNSINLLIPAGKGYAVTSEGRIYNLTTTPTRIIGQDLSGGSRPQFEKFEDKLLIVDGSTVVLDTVTNTTSVMGGSPPAGRFIGRVGAYTLLAGYDDIEFHWSTTNNPENWTVGSTVGDAGFATVKRDGIIKYATSYNNRWFIFKTNEIEVWHNRGGTTPFVRLNELTIPIGLLASYSVIKTKETMYFLDNNSKFRDITGKIISGQYESYIFDKIQNPEDVYGFDYPIENCVRWFSPVDGICLKYDYSKDMWSEDNTWQHGQFERLPHNSYMELNGKQYFGDYDPTGKVFEWSEDYNTDDGSQIRIARKFKIKLTETDNRASVNQIRFMFKRGEGLNGSKAQAFFNFIFDESGVVDTRVIDLGTINQKDPEVTFSRLGTGRTMEIEIIMSDAADFLLTGAKMIAKELGT